MLKSSLCDYSDAYRVLNGTILVASTVTDEWDKQVGFKNSTPFTDCIRQ